MTILRRLAILAIASVVAIGVSAAPASATGKGDKVRGATTSLGTTSVTTAPGLANTLLSNGILPYTVRPGKTELTSNEGTLALRISFPITGGNASLDPLGGVIEHKGGLALVNLHNLKRIKVSDFDVDLNNLVLTGTVDALDDARAPLFTLEPTDSFTIDLERKRVSGVNLRLTEAAAGAINDVLDTDLFVGGPEGIVFGSAVVDYR